MIERATYFHIFPQVPPPLSSPQVRRLYRQTTQTDWMIFANRVWNKVLGTRHATSGLSVGDVQYCGSVNAKFEWK